MGDPGEPLNAPARRGATVCLALLVAGAVASACTDRPAANPRSSAPAKSHPDLAAHSAQFTKGVIEVTDGVHVAIGYGLANSILIEGTDGVIIVDAMESAEAARPVKAAFDAITSKPVRAIIYTHNHADHIFGAAVLAGDDEPEVHAHATTVELIDRIANQIRPIIYRRAMRQFGTMLGPEEFVNAGIGPRLTVDDTTTPALLRPTHSFTGDRTELTIVGIRLELVHAPGETPDQIFVWLPDKRVLLPGDNFYHSFPNLYAIRGTAYRDVMDWVRSLDKMRALRPLHLVPSHTRPISGANDVLVALINYRDAIQYVHDQTVRLINLGLDPEVIVERVKLPPHLADQPYLQEYYGRVDWSVRAIFQGYLGWFGGNATGLGTMTHQARAEHMERLAGGTEALRRQAEDAAASGQHQWALELADHLRVLNPTDDAARALRITSLRALAEQELSANGRNYYLTQALEAEGLTLTPPALADTPPEVLATFPIGAIMHALPVFLDPAKAEDAYTEVGFRFPDTGESYAVFVRRGVAEIRDEFPADPDITVVVDSQLWKEIMAQRRSALAALAKGELTVQGGRIAFGHFMKMFQPE